MTVTVNGRSQDFAAPLTVTQLLKSMQLEPTQVAVERNRTIVLRADFAHTSLQDGDRLEIVRFVGGG